MQQLFLINIAMCGIFKNIYTSEFATQSLLITSYLSDDH